MKVCKVKKEFQEVISCSDGYDDTASVSAIRESKADVGISIQYIDRFSLCRSIRCLHVFY